MRILRPKDTEAKVGLCDRELRDLEARGLFPKRFLINPEGGRAVGHLESEIDQWIAKRAASRSPEQTAA
jgi:predicted DNA-binding transcriptional regulator AlpA